MNKFAQDFQLIQLHTNPVIFAYNKAFDYLGFSSTSAWRDFGKFFTESIKDLQYSPNAYHNQIHSAEAIFSSAILLKEEFNNKELQQYAPYLVFAMMLHDIEHNGGHNHFPYELEKLAVNTMKKVLNTPEVKNYYNSYLSSEFGSLLRFQRRIERIVLGTEFKVGVAKNVQAYQHNTNNNPFVKLNTLANEADIFISVRHDLGIEKGELLAVEQNEPNLATQQGRLYFLEHLVHYVSNASKKLGMQSYLEQQIIDLKNTINKPGKKMK